MAGGKKVYWEKSCRVCGKPSSGSIALNKVSCDAKKGNKARCRNCQRLLFD